MLLYWNRIYKLPSSDEMRFSIFKSFPSSFSLHIVQQSWKPRSGQREWHYKLQHCKGVLLRYEYNDCCIVEIFCTWAYYAKNKQQNNVVVFMV